MRHQHTRYVTAGRETIVTHNTPDLRVERTTYGYCTRYVMRGKPEAVQQHMEEIRRHYPPAGYGTWARAPRFVEAGMVEVEMDRSNTCN